MADRRQKDVKKTDPRQGSKQKTRKTENNSSSAGTKPPSATRPSRSDPNTPARRRSPAPDNSITNAALASSSTSVPSAAVQSEEVDHVILKYSARDRDVLHRELHRNYVGRTWFDSYSSFDELLTTLSKTTTGMCLASLPTMAGERDGTRDAVGLRKAIEDTISYLLDMEAEWNPVTEISSTPRGCSSALWSGTLWLGGIKDSMNSTLLKKKGIDAVVSIHPKDWLAKEVWENIFSTWDGIQNLQDGQKIKQFLIELADDSSSDLRAYFEKAFQFMDYYLLRGKTVLVHCKMGQSRSASLLLGYMVFRSSKSLRMHVASGRPSEDKVSENYEKLKKALKQFTTELASKRNGIDTKNFETQLLQHLDHLARGSRNSNTSAKKPTGLSSPGEKKGGGGILKDAILVLCFMQDLKPTPEVLGYWKSRRETGARYWIQAAKDKSKKNALQGTNFLGRFQGFFDPYLQKPSS